MKKKLLSVFSVAMMLINIADAQTAAVATWPQNTNATNSSVPVGSSGRRVEVIGAITAADQTLGGLNDATYSTSVGTTGYTISGGWQRLTSLSTYTATSTATPPVTSASLPFVTGGIPDYTHYAEYKIQPSANTNLTVKEFKISALGGGTGGARAVVLYSLDNFATAGVPMPVVGAYSTAAAVSTNYAATEAAPVVLINTGSQFTTSSGGTTPNGIEKLVFGNMSIAVNPAQTFSVRVYPFLSAASTTSSRYFMSQQASISGETTPATTPLDFTSFTAKSSLSNQIKLDWKTTNEVNTKNFVVERSNNGGSFTSIGSVDSKNTAGEHSYSFTDNSPLAGTNYYRLSQVDNDGKSKYSKTVSAESKGGVSVSVYPSPATGNTVTVSYPSSSTDATLTVVTLGGAQVSKVIAEAGSTGSTVDVSGLAAGYYLVKYSNGKDEKSVKFVKQ